MAALATVAALSLPAQAQAQAQTPQVQGKPPQVQGKPPQVQNKPPQRRACAHRTVLQKGLKKRYSEVPISMGLTNTGGVIELLTKADGSSWTITITMPNGITCIVAAGEAWVTVSALRGEAS